MHLRPISPEAPHVRRNILYRREILEAPCSLLDLCACSALDRSFRAFFALSRRTILAAPAFFYSGCLADRLYPDRGMPCRSRRARHGALAPADVAVSSSCFYPRFRITLARTLPTTPMFARLFRYGQLDHTHLEHPCSTISGRHQHTLHLWARRRSHGW